MSATLIRAPDAPDTPVGRAAGGVAVGWLATKVVARLGGSGPGPVVFPALDADAGNGIVLKVVIVVAPPCRRAWAAVIAGRNGPSARDTSDRRRGCRTHSQCKTSPSTGTCGHPCRGPVLR